MMKINLLENLTGDLVTSKPDKEKIMLNWRNHVVPSKMVDPYMEGTKKEIRRRRTFQITMCGCGKHPVNPKKDIYEQHNHWMAQQHEKVENGSSDLRGVKGIGASIQKAEFIYDFSGEEFEISPEQIRKLSDENER